MRLINPEVRIETTSKCNSNCIMCPRDSMTRGKVTMSFDHFKRLAQESKKLGAETIALFGFGEPLMDGTIAEKVALVSTIGMEPIFTTNASLLTEAKTHALLDAGLKQIRFSVHGLSDTYEKTHIGLSWHVTFKNIINFISMSMGQCVTNVSVIPMHGESLDEIKDLWLPLVDYLEVWRPHSWAGLKKYRNPQQKIKTCGRPSSGPIQINADGTMIVCCFDVNGVMIIGNTYENTIAEILNGERLAKIVNAHANGDMAGLLCCDCDQLNCYTEEDYPLLFSNRDKSRRINTTSSTKFNLIGEKNGTYLH